VAYDPACLLQAVSNQKREKKEKKLINKLAVQQKLYESFERPLLC
jgi:hypothetical protein